MICDQPIICDGCLLKFTNMVKGYQYRWFTINNRLATLDYYEKEEHKYSFKPRGCISLIFADVCPSVEDHLTFIVNAKTGNYFKLKAQDTRERQEWINNIRSAISYFNTNLQSGRFYIDVNGGLFKMRNEKGTFPSTTSLNFSENNTNANIGVAMCNNDDGIMYSNTNSFREPNDINIFDLNPFKNANSLTAQMDDVFLMILKNIDTLPTFSCASGLSAYDKNLLITKATCAATIDCLKYCVTLLRHRRFYHTKLNNRKCDMNSRNMLPNNNPMMSESQNVSGSVNSLPTIGTEEKKNSDDDDVSNPTMVSAQSIDELSKMTKLDVMVNKCPSTNNLNSKFLLPIEGMDVEAPNPIDLTQAIEDADCFDKIQSEGDVNCLDENKSVLHHLLSQVKLGMDLTKVTLPTFILEKRSLLEMFSDYMAHPDLFLKISDEQTPEHRMRALFIWYITAFHAGRKSSVAKKPYNPIIGETFHCMWHVPDKKLNDGDSTCHHLNFTAEQVSHHPPITAFYVTCPSKNIRLNASIHTKSKFQGMSIVAQMEGKVILYLDEHGEEYQFTLPNAHAKNILSVPKLELGDKVTITCAKTKYSSSLVFHSKKENCDLGSFENEVLENNEALFGHSSVNKISGEIRDPDNKVLVRLTGDWNTVLEIEDVKTNSFSSINVSELFLYKKCVSPENKQKVHESRKLWHSVTESLYNNDMDRATKYKKELESRQRQSENVRNSKKQQFPVKYFQSSLDGRWVFRQELTYRTKIGCSTVGYNDK